MIQGLRIVSSTQLMAGTVPRQAQQIKQIPVLAEVDVLKSGWMGVIICFYSSVTIIASCPG